MFDPRIRAAATPRTAFLPLLTAAFWNGYSDASTERLTGTNMRTAPHTSSFIPWYIGEIAEPWNSHISIRLLYALLLLIFPAVSRTGRLWYILTNHENRDRQRYA
jgi:hypothetical protein